MARVADIRGETVAHVGKNVVLEGRIEFCSSVQYLKWQKWNNGEYIDINIHKSKYKGTNNFLRNPKLVINDVELEDGGFYRIKFQWTTKEEHSNIHKLRILPRTDLETMTIEVQSDQRNGRYYAGEDVFIKASIKNVSRILCMAWQKETETIDTSLPNYIESGNDETGEYTLTIRNSTESDKGAYFLLAACTDNVVVKSNRIQLNVVQESPGVILSPVPEAAYDTMFKYKASVRSFIEHTKTIWKKGGAIIDINNRKYEGSSNVGNSPVLCINNVNEEDEDVYTIVVSNDWGKTSLDFERLVLTEKEPAVSLKISDQSQSVAHGNTITLQAEIKSYPAPSCIRWTRTCMKYRNNEEIIDKSGKFTIDKSDPSCPKLTIENLDFNDNGNYIINVTNDLGCMNATFEIKIEVNQFIFISGPVVVSPAGLIEIQTLFKSNQNCLDAKWLKLKANFKMEIPFESSKYCMVNSSNTCKTNFQKLVIHNAGKEDEAKYQLSFDHMLSNEINIFVNDSGKFPTETEGNYYRYIAIQIVCADALRKAFDNLPDTFEEKMKKIRHHLQTNPSMKGIFQNLDNKTPSSSKDLDVSFMYSIIRNLNYIEKPKNGWGQKPKTTDISMADDLERIRHYRNKIVHESPSEMKTRKFNDAVLELIWVIRRLSKNDVKLTEDICEAMNKVFIKGENIEKITVELRIIQEESQHWEYLRSNELQDDAQATETETAFHHVHDSGILVLNNGRLAIHREWSNRGVCFMNRPLKVEEKIHIRGVHYCMRASQETVTKIGLTDINPDKLREAEDKGKDIRSSLKPIQCCDMYNPSKQRHAHWLEDFHICVSLRPNASLAISMNDSEQKIYDYQINSTYHPLWLVFELAEIASIWIARV